MILQCVVGSIIIFIPSSVEHRYHIDIPVFVALVVAVIGYFDLRKKQKYH